MTTGHKTRLWCSQDEKRKQKSRPSQREGAKHRDTLGMERFDCKSRLIVSCKKGSSTDERIIIIRLQHHAKHKPYYDVAIPQEALEIIQENLEWCTPNSLATKIQALYPSVTTNQVHAAWTTMSETLWKRDPDPMTSAKMLLEEYPDDMDMFKVTAEEGVKQLCWGQKRILLSLKGKIVEVGLDATCT